MARFSFSLLFLLALTASRATAAPQAAAQPEAGQSTTAAPAKPAPQRPLAQPSANQPSLTAFSNALETLADRVSQSVVQVVVVGYAPATENAAPSSDTLLERQRSTGSGVIVDQSGFIITNHHVVAGARRVQVMLPVMRDPATGRSIVRPKGRVVEAKIVGIDEETDLAVLKVDQTGLQPLRFGDSDNLKPGQIVCAFGSPLGLENSMSMGVVSAVGRQLEPDDPMVYVQTDAPINPGNSGGPLVDTEGRLVGISTLILSQSGGNEGLGFAAPSNIVEAVFQQLRTTGRVKRGTIGVHAQTLTPLLARGLGLPHDVGVLLGDVQPKSTGAAAGLQIGDIVLALDGKPMENGRQFDVNLYRRAAGDVASLEVMRDGNRMTFPVAVAERDDDPMRFADLVSPEKNVIERLGVLALDVTPAVSQAVGGLRRNGGVLVAMRAVNAAAEYGLEPGDVIFSVNNTPVNALVALRTIVGRLPTNAPCVLQVQRQGQLMFLSFEIE
jgi:serine protease Do